MQKRQLRSLGLALVLLFWTLPAAAKYGMGLVASGGVSLGAYQGGFLYYATYFNQLNPNVEIKLVTGASAGSINGFMTLLASCAIKPTTTPQESLFWRAWIPLGFQQLADVKQINKLNLFSRAAFAPTVSMLQQVWFGGLRQGCTRVFGVTVTRREPLVVAIEGDVTTRRHAEQFVIKVVGRGPGKPPSISQILRPNHHRHQIALALGDTPEQSFAAVINLLFASSAFPLAFAPIELGYCLFKPNTTNYSCSGAAIETAFFVDGGVFDNNPLHLAYKISDDNDGPFSNQPVQSFGYLDVDAQAYPYSHDADNAPISALFAMARFLGDFIGTARDKERNTLLVNHPEVAHRVFHTKVHMPLASAPMYAFLGFFERDFRIFDFYQGMHDAKKYIQQLVKKQPNQRFPGDQQNASHWQILHCLEAAVAGQVTDAKQCGVDIPRNLRILFAASLARLKTHCRSLPIGTKTTHALCQKEIPTQANFLDKDSQQSAPADNLTFIEVINDLAARRFAFEDLGLTPETADLAMIRLKQKLTRLLAAFANQQPEDQRQVLRTIARPVLNVLEYTPSSNIGYLLAGNSWELGLSTMWPRIDNLPGWLRLNVGLQVNGVRSLFVQDRDTVALTPIAGFEAEPLIANDAFYQWRLGFRIGYQKSLRRTENACSNIEEAHDPYACTLTTLQPFVALGLLDILRLQLNWQNFWQNGHIATDASQWMFMTGIQFHY